MDISFFKHKSKKEVLDVFSKYGIAISRDDFEKLKVKNLDHNYYYIYCDDTSEFDFDQNYIVMSLCNRVLKGYTLYYYRPSTKLGIVQTYGDNNISNLRYDIYYKCHKRYFNSLSIKDIRNNLANILNTNKYKLIDIE